MYKICVSYNLPSSHSVKGTVVKQPRKTVCGLNHVHEIK